MNFIKKLQKENHELKLAAEKAENKLRELAGYMYSRKFHNGDELDGYINVKDVSAYINKALSTLNEVTPCNNCKNNDQDTCRACPYHKLNY